jgi:uncharacterized membrane-anchored protein
VTALHPALPPDHPERRLLADEVHARPPEPVETPSRASYVAVLASHEQRTAEFEHVSELCRAFGAEPPAAGTTHFSTSLGELRFKWERHGEFSSYTFAAPGVPAGPPFGATATSLLPDGWLAEVPGLTMVAAHAELLPAPDDPPDADFLAARFGANTPVGSEVGDGNGFVYTDFRIHEDGCSRFVVLDRRFRPVQAGRTLQRLFEIEAYRMLGLLALPIARAQAIEIAALERSLAKLTDDMTRGRGDDEELLQELTRLAAEVESELASSQSRFGATRAYHELVATRIAELRERRLAGIQTVEEFMARRLTPAVATTTRMSQRLQNLSERIDRARGLLSARVDVAREKQNAAVLESLNRRARLQLRLQETVELLSIAAIVYYVAGLVNYIAKGLDAGDPDRVVAVAIPIIAVVVIGVAQLLRHRILAAHRGAGRAEG